MTVPTASTSFYANNPATVYTESVGATPDDQPNPPSSQVTPSSFYKGTGLVYDASGATDLIYFGPLASDPTLDPFGNPLTDGDLYFSTTLNTLKVWNGSSWQPIMVSFNGRGGVVVPQTGDYSFSQISGVAAPSQLPTPTTSTIGGVEAVNAVAHEWVSSIDTSGVPHLTQPSVSDISGGAALTEVNDTNVTLTLGGTPATALLGATSITAGWTGTLAATRLNGNVVQGITNDTNVTGSITAQVLTLGWTGTLAAARLNANVVQGVTNDTNVTGTIASQGLTLGWTGTLAPSRGGTGLGTLTAHAVLLGEGTSNVAFATIGTSGRLLIDQGAAADPAFEAMSGDATITNLGALTIAAGAVTNAKMAATMAAGTVKSNVTGSTAGPSDNTVSAVLDVVGNVQGDVLYRGASTWAVLAPGTSGQVLTTGGSSANPSWTTPSGGGSSGHGQCRLTLSGSSLLLSPYNGQALIINAVQQTIPSGGVSLAVTGLTASTLYYIYAFMSGSTMTLEASTTSHVTSSTNGVETKSGDASRTLVGMVFTDATPAFNDSTTKHNVASWFNRLPKGTQGLFTSNHTLTNQDTNPTEVATEIRTEGLCWGDSQINIGGMVGAFAGATGISTWITPAISTNNGTSFTTQSGAGLLNGTASTSESNITNNLTVAPGEGHWMLTLQSLQSAAGSVTFSGSATSTRASYLGATTWI